MTPEEQLLLEQVTSAHRERGSDGLVRFHPAWSDLGEAGRLEAHRQTQLLRAMEAALDPLGHSSTIRAVMARLRTSRGA